MTKEEIALECVRLAIPLTSPSVSNRFEGVAELSGKLYSHVIKLAEDTPAVEKPTQRPTISVSKK
jgi:hypothetical protein